MTSVTLPHVPFTVRDSMTYSPATRAWKHVGRDAVRACYEKFHPGMHVAADIETNGTERKFDIRCVTFAWYQGPKIISVFLDPRVPEQADAIRHINEHCGLLILHNSTFDVPPLYQAGLMKLEHVFKVWDTLIVARMINTADRSGRTLDDLVRKYTDFPEIDRKITDAFTTMGARNGDEGYARATTPDPVWRDGAMADTVATLMLMPALNEAAVKRINALAVDDGAWHLPTAEPELTQHTQSLIMREQTTNRVMLRRSALGIAVDHDYMTNYKNKHAEKLREARALVESAGLDPDAGNVSTKLIEMLDARGELPADWPRTATGRLSGDKKALASIKDNPLAVAVRSVKEMDKITGYLEKIELVSSFTGRVHPTASILGAHATGRMSYSDPELQQFPADARPILCADEGREITSIDWSAIEPVVLANAAQDWNFIDEFNRGGDLYIPAAKMAGLIPHHLTDAEAAEHPGRKQAKVVVLANMYGQGRALLASNLGATLDEADRIKESYNSAMQPTVDYLSNLRNVASSRGYIRTLDGRPLDIPKDTRPDARTPGAYMGYKAMNYFVQGTAYSLLSDTINRIHAAGLSDAIYLAMHDELVVDSEAAHDIQKIMVTPPEWLNQVAGREVILRSDMNPMGRHWQYV